MKEYSPSPLTTIFICGICQDYMCVALSMKPMKLKIC